MTVGSGSFGDSGVRRLGGRALHVIRCYEQLHDR